MRLHAEGVIGAPLEQTWQALLDVDRLASAMPGASLRPATPDGVRRGTLAVDGTAYAGSARLVEVDEDEHTSAFTVHAREVGGSGAVSATIRNRFTAHDAGTHVSVEAELHVTGRAHVPDAAGAEAMNRFVTGLQHQVAAGGRPDMRAALALARARPRAAAAVAAAVVGVAAAVLVGRRVLRRRGGLR